MILAYRILINLIYPFLIIFIYYRKFLNKEDPIRFKEKIFFSNFNLNKKKEKKLIWFHAASIGEFRSIVPIIKEMNKDNSLEFLITTTTLSSSKLVGKEFKNFHNIHHRFFPLDVGFLIEKFLSSWSPSRIFLIDSEIWPNLILIAKKKGIPLALINARLTKKTFKKWMKFPKTAKKIFRVFNLCLASNKETKDYLDKLEAKNVYFFGNLKLINEIDEDKIKNLNENILSNRRFWFAASTHQGEDLFCLKVHKKIKEKYKDVITIIAPRHIHRVKDINALSNNLSLKTQVLNQGEIIQDNKEIIIINSFGVLQDYFKYAKSVFIGKSTLKELKNEGGQNPIDAAKLGCKIYHGPHVYNFIEIYDILEKNNITQKIETYEELSYNLVEDLKNPLKTKSKFLDHIKNLGEKTFRDTMKNIINFIK
jgi:3-deoxy-D-manno-octulosonic-acid transferase